MLDHLNTLNSLCLVLGMDFKHTVNDVDPTLDNSSSTKNVSADTIERLYAAISRLNDVKIQRMQKVSGAIAPIQSLSDVVRLVSGWAGGHSDPSNWFSYKILR